MGTRSYRINAAGIEVPVWASRRKLREMGRAWGEQAFRNGAEPIRYGNREHDLAALEEYQRLTTEREKTEKSAGR